MTDRLDQLVVMSQTMGQPERDWVILGEGNTSTRADKNSFWVKASGTQLAFADRSTFVRVDYKRVLDALDDANLTDTDVGELLRAATREGNRAPSIETFLHALCLQLDGIDYVGHTHPTAAVGLLASTNSRELFDGAMFPDQIVLLGTAHIYIPYTDPGLPLARVLRDELDDFLYRKGEPPRLILMENHGVIALGKTARQVINITEMFVKLCHVISISILAGGPRYLAPHHVERIATRPDEQRRRKDLA